MDMSTNNLAQIMQVMDLQNPQATLDIPTTNTLRPDQTPAAIPDLASMLFSSEQMNNLAVMLSMQGMPSTMPLSLFNPFAPYGLPSLPIGLPALPPHSTIDSLSLGDQTPLIRPMSQSAVPSAQPSSSNDVRPRAFSSAATLQHLKNRKRSHNSFEAKKQQFPLLCGLIERNDDQTSTSQQATVPNKSEEEMIMEEVSRVLARSKPPQKRSAPVDDINSIKLTPLIQEEDLPDVPDKSSPFRHHFKYNKRKDLCEDKQKLLKEVASFCMFTGVWVPVDDLSEASMTPSSSNGSPKPMDVDFGCSSPKKPKTLSEMLEYTLAMELITAE